MTIKLDSMTGLPVATAELATSYVFNSTNALDYTRLSASYITDLAQNVVETTSGTAGIGQMSSVELAKVWILATHGLVKTWVANTDVVLGGFPSCARAIAVATAEAGGDTQKIDAFSPAFGSPSVLPVANPGTPWGGCDAISGGCWQTSSFNCGDATADNVPSSVCTTAAGTGEGGFQVGNLANPFCGALQAWMHQAPGSSQLTVGLLHPAAPSCNKTQLMATGFGNDSTKGCNLGALSYLTNSSGWNSPPRAAMFRMCGGGTTQFDPPYESPDALAAGPYGGGCNDSLCGAGSSTAPPVSWSMATSCQIAICAADQAVKELNELYKGTPHFVTRVEFEASSDHARDPGYDMFTKACTAGPATTGI
jgi:hypothetical protein